jgi:uncharacterized protein (TIGR03435 family)
MGMRLAVVAAGMAAQVVAQVAPSSPAKFEVASVKLSRWVEGEGCPQSMKMDRGRVDIACATVATLIGYAFRFSPDRVKGPEWMMAVGTPRFDIAAKLPEGALVYHVPEMLQSLLAERFQLALHRAATRQPVYALVAGKGGPKLQAAEQLPGASAPDAQAESLDFYGTVQTRTVSNATAISNPRMGTVLETDGPGRIQQWHAPSISMEGLADLLDKAAPLSLPIVDRTGMKGRYQLVLQVSLNGLSRGQPGDMEATILRAFNDGLRRLGLQLERLVASVETLIVDRVEKVPAAN